MANTFMPEIWYIIYRPVFLQSTVFSQPLTSIVHLASNPWTRWVVGVTTGFKQNSQNEVDIRQFAFSYMKYISFTGNFFLTSSSS